MTWTRRSSSRRSNGSGGVRDRPAGRAPDRAMYLDQLPGDVHLTYCTNIHAGETWSEVRSSLAAHVPQIKNQVSPQNPMGLGLRLSAIAAEELSIPDALSEFRRFLADHGIYVF